MSLLPAVKDFKGVPCPDRSSCHIHGYRRTDLGLLCQCLHYRSDLSPTLRASVTTRKCEGRRYCENSARDHGGAREPGGEHCHEGRLQQPNGKYWGRASITCTFDPPNNTHMRRTIDQRRYGLGGDSWSLGGGVGSYED